MMGTGGGRRALLLSRKRVEPLIELPKGHVEPGESLQSAAARELREETGLQGEAIIGREIGVIQYSFGNSGSRVHKTLRIFLATTRNQSLPVVNDSGRVLLRWIKSEEVETVPLVNEDLRPILRTAFATPPAERTSR